MINISHYCATSQIKPEIAHVLVKNNNDTIEMVATDSYRLARIVYTLDKEPLLENIKSGLYPSKAFKEFCTAWNKKKASVTDKMHAIELLEFKKSEFPITSYPDYMQLIPTEKTLRNNEGIQADYNASYLVDHIALVAELKPTTYGKISMRDVYDSNKRMNIYYDQETGNTALLMQLTN